MILKSLIFLYVYKQNKFKYKLNYKNHKKGKLMSCHKVSESSSSLWAKTVESTGVKYKFMGAEQRPAISEIAVNNQCGMHTIVLAGQDTATIYDLIKKSLHEKYTDTLGPISLVNKDIWIRARNIHSENPEALRPILDKIYQVIEPLFPHFNQVKEEIDHTLISFGNTEGLNYFSKKTINQPQKAILTDVDDQSFNSGPTKLFDSEQTKIYRINGRVWTQEIINTPQSGFFNNYSSSIQYGSSSDCRYSTPHGSDGKVTYISITNQEVYYPDEDRVVNRKTFIVKSNNERLYYQEHHYDINKKLNSFVENGILDKEFIDIFF